MEEITSYFREKEIGKLISKDFPMENRETDEEFLLTLVGRENARV